MKSRVLHRTAAVVSIEPFLGELSSMPNNLCEFLLAFEPEVAALAALRRQFGQADSLQELVDRTLWVTNTLAWLDAETAIHRTVAELSGNLFFQALEALVMPKLCAAVSELPAAQLERLRYALIRPNQSLAAGIARGDGLGAKNGALEIIRQLQSAFAT